MTQSLGDEFNDRNFESISPSAKRLILMKGYSDLPFARETAELLMHPEPFVPDFSKKNFTFWTRLVHFENRYRSIDDLLDELPITNILELSSGYSFRGLELARRKKCHYIDTDLSEAIEFKKEAMKRFVLEDLAGTIEYLPLNALDENRFREIVARFPAGEIAIVNEGLLMYLDDAEKEKLCAIIKRILQERGGYWITADVYLKRKADALNLKFGEQEKKFFEEQQIEEKRFESFEAAEALFDRAGLIRDRVANVARQKLSAIPCLLKNSTPEELSRLQGAEKIQATWRLKVKER
jgi:O-methyltransferase involved in polyketide biosynthesis